MVLGVVVMAVLIVRRSSRPRPRAHHRRRPAPGPHHVEGRVHDRPPGVFLWSAPVLTAGNSVSMACHCSSLVWEGYRRGQVLIRPQWIRWQWDHADTPTLLKHALIHRDRLRGRLRSHLADFLRTSQIVPAMRRGALLCDVAPRSTTWTALRSAARSRSTAVVRAAADPTMLQSLSTHLPRPVTRSSSPTTHNATPWPNGEARTPRASQCFCRRYSMSRVRPLAAALVLVAAVVLSVTGAGSATARETAATPSPAVQITPGVAQRAIVSPREVFLDTTIDFTTLSGPVLLAGDLDGTGKFGVDDEISLTVTTPNGSVSTFTKNFEFQPPTDPIDISSYFAAGSNSVHVVLRDTFGVFLGSTPIWLVNTSPIAQDPGYVALGDSFASGEGANEKYFQLGTSFSDPKVPGATTGCHRSSTAWSNLVADQALKSGLVKTVDYATCSGAVAQDLYNTNRTYERVHETEPDQLSFVSKRTVLATLSLGGNDVGFADILLNCVSFPTSGPNGIGCRKRGTQANSLVTTRLAWLRGGGIPTPNRPGGATASLADIYRDIAARMAPGGTLIVAGYPRLFAESKNLYLLPTRDGGGCRVGSRGPLSVVVSYQDAQWLNQVADAADAAIADSVTSANQALAGTTNPVNVVYRPVSGNFVGHRLCSFESFINGVELTSAGPKPNPKQQSFHPKKEGQTAYYRAVCTAVPDNGRPSSTCAARQQA